MRKPRKLATGYQARVTWEGRDRSIGVFSTEAEAMLAQAEWEKEHRYAAVDPDILFEEYAALVLEARMGEVTEATLSNDRGRIRKWILPTFAKVRVAEITHTRVKIWFHSLPDIPSRRLIYNTLSVILDHAVQDGLLRVKPKVRGATKITKAQAKTLYSSEQIWSVIDNLPEWARPAFIVQWGFAGRISEMLGLTWDRVDLKNGRVVITAQLYKGEQVQRVKHGSEGSVPLTDEALAVLRELRKKSPAIGSTPVFLTPTGHRLNARRAYELWHAARTAAGLPDIVTHDLRRNDLSHYRVATGHDAIKTMQRGRQRDYRSYLAYQHDTTPEDRTALDALNAAKRKTS